MTTRRVERRHREAAARARWPLAYGNGEPLANWLQAWVDQEADYTGVDGAALLAIANAIAAAEHPAPSAPVEFDPVMLEQVIRWLYDRGHKTAATDLDCNWNDGPPGDGSCRKIREMVGLTESPKGKEDANG